MEKAPWRKAEEGSATVLSHHGLTGAGLRVRFHPEGTCIPRDQHSHTAAASPGSPCCPSPSATSRGAAGSGPPALAHLHLL